MAKQYILAFGLILIILNLGLISAEPFYSLLIDSSNGNLKINSLKIIFLQEKITSEGEYIAEIKSFDNKVLDREYFSFSDKIYVEYIASDTGKIEGGFSVDNPTIFNLYLPYYKNAKEIVLYSSEKNELAKVDVSEYSREIPEKTKTTELEPIDKGVKKSEDKKEIKSNYQFLIGIVIIMLIAIAIIVYLIKKQKLNFSLITLKRNNVIP